MIYYIAKKIKCSKSYCVMASILFYTMPIAVAEAFTTQVDNYSALWMLCFTYLILDLLNPKKKITLNKETLFRISILALCIAFGYLAKPSIGIAWPFFALWLLIIIIKRKDNIAILAAYLLVAGCILMVILAPEFLRNIETFDALSDPVAGERQLIGTLKPRYVLVNFLKNFTFNMPTVWIYNSTEIILKCVEKFAGLLKVEINNPTISEDGRIFGVHTAQSYGHDTAVNPVIIYLLIVCVICLIVKNRKKHLTDVRNQYFIVTCISFLVFCAVLRWEPFVSRYMISYFAILCPGVIGQLEMVIDSGNEKSQKNKTGLKAVLYFVCLAEFLGLLYYHGKVAMTYARPEGYFGGRAELAGNYKKIADIVSDKGYTNIGLIVGYDSCEYPLLAMLDNQDRIKHVNVTNPTGKYEDWDFVPDAIIILDCDISSEALLCHEYEYEIAEVVSEKIYLLEKREAE